MRILYYGQLKEIGTRLCNSLACKNDVVAISSKESDYGLNCDQYLIEKTDVVELLKSRQIELVLVFVPDGVNYTELYQLMKNSEKIGVKHFGLIHEAGIFRKSSTIPELEELLCREFSNKGMKSFIVDCSSLYGKATTPKFLRELYSTLQKEGVVSLPDNEEIFCDAMHVDDMCLFINTMVDNKFDQIGDVVHIQSAYPFLLYKFMDEVCKRYPQATVKYELPTEMTQEYDIFSSPEWSPQHSFLEHVEECIFIVENEYKTNKFVGTKRTASQIGRWATIALAFVAVELYLQFVPIASDLQFVDLRLLLIVCAGLFYGKKMGIVAATCCSISSIIHCLISGVKWYVLFYHIDNWIPIAVYFVAAIIIGVFHDELTEATQHGVN